jgi:hypothetical protein
MKLTALILLLVCNINLPEKSDVQLVINCGKYCKNKQQHEVVYVKSKKLVL